MSKTPRTDAACDYTAPEKLHWLAKDLESELTAATAELAELRRDKARLDCMQHYAESHNGHWLDFGDGWRVCTTDDIREEIDAVLERGEG